MSDEKPMGQVIQIDEARIREHQVRDLDVPPQLRSRPAKFISFNSAAVEGVLIYDATRIVPIRR